MQRSLLFIALACVAALLLPACGENAGGGGIEGTWVIDKPHFEGEVMKMFDAAMAAIPGVDELPAAMREMADKKMDQQRTAMKKAVDESDFAVVIKADGTWTGTGSIMGDSEKESGTWSLDGDQFTVVTIGEEGKEKKKDKKGIFDGSTIEMHMEEGRMKATLRLIRQ